MSSSSSSETVPSSAILSSNPGTGAIFAHKDVKDSKESKEMKTDVKTESRNITWVIEDYNKKTQQLWLLQPDNALKSKIIAELNQLILDIPNLISDDTCKGRVATRIVTSFKNIATMKDDAEKELAKTEQPYYIRLPGEASPAKH